MNDEHLYKIIAYKKTAVLDEYRDHFTFIKTGEIILNCRYEQARSIATQLEKFERVSNADVERID